DALDGLPGGAAAAAAGARTGGARPGRSRSSARVHAPDTVRRGAATGGDRPGPGRAPGAAAGRRTDRQPGPGQRRRGAGAVRRPARRRSDPGRDHPRRPGEPAGRSPGADDRRPAGGGVSTERPGSRPGSRLRPADLVDEAILGIGSRPARLLLTMIGTVIGIGALVATVGLGQTAGGQIAERFDAAAATRVVLRPADAGF